MLEIKKIKKVYVTGDFKQVALDDVSVSFRECEFASILGPSGSGKTTLLNIIGGLDHYDSGDLVINNISTKKYKESDWDSYRNHRIGFVFQNYNLISHQTVLANVELALTLSGVSKKTRTRKAKEALTKVGLAKHIHKRPNQLSGGQMQRVAIARALVNDPDILLADEPTGALDSETSKQIMDILKDISKNKLVIMVTHNPELANIYSTRIIKLKDGKIVDDSNPYDLKEEETIKSKSSKTSMSLFTALSLSLNNLMTKKGRTFLTAFAGSIGIIGIALILSLSSGMQEYIDKTEKETLSSYPITISKKAYDLGDSVTFDFNNNKSCDGCVYDDITNSSMMALTNEVTNNLKDFKIALDNNFSNIKDYVTDISYSYNVKLHIFSSKNNRVYELDSSPVLRGDILEQLIDNKELLDGQYEILEGRMPEKYDELVLILDKNGSIPLSLLYGMDVLDSSLLPEEMRSVKAGKKDSLDTPNYTYKDFIGLTYKLVLNTSYYKKVNGGWSNIAVTKEKVKELVDNGIELKVVGVMKMSDSTQAAATNVLGYKKELIEYVIDKNNNSEIGKEQLSDLSINIATGYPYEDDTTLDSMKYILGIASIDDPTSVNIYPKNYAAKDEVKKIISEYNNTKGDTDKIVYTDYVGMLMGGITSVINVITYVLVAFVAISLVVSSIMISIITYISVLERTKEIGILRSIGASKKDITRVFNAETIIEGFVAGVFGVLVTLLLCIPINKVIESSYGVTNIAKLPLGSGLLLILISVILTVIAGLIPSRMAAKKDPVEALRSE